MKNGPFVITLIAVAGAATVAVHRAFVSGDPAHSLATLERIETRLADLERHLAGVDTEIGRLQELADHAAGPELRLSSTAVQESVAALIEEEARAAREATTAATARPDGSAAEIDLDAFLERVRTGQVDQEEFERVFAELAKAGLLDQAIAGLQELVANDPMNPDLRVDLGSAYLQKLLTLPEGPARGIAALAADAAFDEALEIDPRHWEARFTKAVSLAFWPPLFGKQAVAVKNFETLIAQQEELGGASQPHYEHSYLFLGNLYQQQGDVARAREMWGRGLVFFPSSGELRQAIEQ